MPLPEHPPAAPGARRREAVAPRDRQPRRRAPRKRAAPRGGDPLVHQERSRRDCRRACALRTPRSCNSAPRPDCGTTNGPRPSGATPTSAAPPSRSPAATAAVSSPLPKDRAPKGAVERRLPKPHRERSQRRQRPARIAKRSIGLQGILRARPAPAESPEQLSEPSYVHGMLIVAPRAEVRGACSPKCGTGRGGNTLGGSTPARPTSQPATASPSPTGQPWRPVGPTASHGSGIDPGESWEVVDPQPVSGVPCQPHIGQRTRSIPLAPVFWLPRLHGDSRGICICSMSPSPLDSIPGDTGSTERELALAELPFVDANLDWLDLRELRGSNVPSWKRSWFA